MRLVGTKLLRWVNMKRKVNGGIVEPTTIHKGEVMGLGNVIVSEKKVITTTTLELDANAVLSLLDLLAYSSEQLEQDMNNLTGQFSYKEDLLRFCNDIIKDLSIN